MRKSKFSVWLENKAQQLEDTIDEETRSAEGKANGVLGSIDEKIGGKYDSLVEKWESLDDKTKSDIKKSAAGGGVGFIFGGIPAVIGLGYAAKKAYEAYKREKKKKDCYEGNE